MTTSHPFGFGSSPLSIDRLVPLARPAVDHLVAVGGPCLEQVVTRPPKQSVVFARVELVLDRLEAAVEGVGAGATREKVGPLPADQEVVALITLKGVWVQYS